MRIAGWTCWRHAHARAGRTGSITPVTAPNSAQDFAPPARPPETVKILVYSDDRNVRETVKLALGKRVHPDLPVIEYVETATEDATIQAFDAGGLTLAILDGEAVPAGGMGIAHQVKDEIYDSPPILVITGRAQDAWLAAWSKAEAAVSHPIDPIHIAETVAGLLRGRLAAG